MSHTDWAVRWWEGDDQIERTVVCEDISEAYNFYEHLNKIATPERRAELPLRRHDPELLFRVVPDWTVSITPS